MLLLHPLNPPAHSTLPQLTSVYCLLFYKENNLYLNMMMADPMADMGPQKLDSGAMEKEVFDPMILTLNLARIERIRSVMAIASGCIAGISGFTGLQGFGV